MFWRKKKSLLQESTSDLISLAARLGVERRLNVRVTYSTHAFTCKLPQIGINEERFIIQDISVGGCCLLDPRELLGPSIGQDIKLQMVWTTGTELIDARIVSRVDERRHIQFLNLGEKRQELLKKFMAFGIRGQSVRCSSSHDSKDPRLTVMAAELWSSMQGDSIIVENDLHRLAQIQLGQDGFVIFKQATPTHTGRKGPCNKIELDQLILFLTNIPKPSLALKSILAALEDQQVSSNGGPKR